MPTDDPGFRKLVRWRASAHHDYDAATLETALGEHFASVTRTPLSASGRVLYTVVQLKNNTPDWFANDVVDSFLVRISPNDSVQ